MIKIRKPAVGRTDWKTLGLCLFCSAVSTVVLVSIGRYQLGGFSLNEQGNIVGLGGYSKAFTQGFVAVVGAFVALGISKLDYRGFVRWWPVHMAVTWGLTLPTLVLHNYHLGKLIIGYDAGGTGNYSWYRIGALSLQPAELAKISFIITLAIHLNKVKEKLNHPLVLLPVLAHILLPVALIHVQGDDGTAMVFGVIGLVMLFSAGLSWKYIWGSITLATAGIVGAVALLGEDRLLKSYQIGRIMALIYPEDEAFANYAYQQNKGILSVGSGQLFGRGLFAETHNYVPYVWNDFIFSYIAEAFGFLGCMILLAALFGIAVRILLTGLHSTDAIGQYICCGIFGAMFFQILLNVGMNLQVLPVIGVTLPFVSAGGTSALMLYLCIGMQMSVYRFNQEKDAFDTGA